MYLSACRSSTAAATIGASIENAAEPQGQCQRQTSPGVPRRYQIPKNENQDLRRSSFTISCPDSRGRKGRSTESHSATTVTNQSPEITFAREFYGCAGSLEVGASTLNETPSVFLIESLTLGVNNHVKPLTDRFGQFHAQAPWQGSNRRQSWH